MSRDKIISNLQSSELFSAKITVDDEITGSMNGLFSIFDTEEFKTAKEWLTSSDFWGALGVMFCVDIVCGNHYNRITNMPYIALEYDGYIRQCWLETTCIMIAYSMFILGMLLILHGCTEKDNVLKVNITITGLIMVCVFSSVLLYVFRHIHSSYPYHFLL